MQIVQQRIHPQEFYESVKREPGRTHFLRTLFNNLSLAAQRQDLAASIYLQEKQLLMDLGCCITILAAERGIAPPSLGTLAAQNRVVELESKLNCIDTSKVNLWYELREVRVLSAMAVEILLRHFPNRGDLIFRKADLISQNPLSWAIADNSIERVRFILNKCPSEFKLQLACFGAHHLNQMQGNTYQLHLLLNGASSLDVLDPKLNPMKQDVVIAATCFQLEVESDMLRPLVQRLIQDIYPYIPFIEEVPFLYDLILEEDPDIFTRYIREKGGFNGLNKEERIRFYRFLTPEEKHSTLATLTEEDHQNFITIDTLLSLAVLQSIDHDEVDVFTATNRLLSSFHPVTLSLYGTVYFDLFVNYLPYMDSARISYIVPFLTKEQLEHLEQLPLPPMIHTTIFSSMRYEQRLSLNLGLI